MSADLSTFAPKPIRVDPAEQAARARQDLYHAMDTLRLEIACCSSLKEAFAIYQALQPMALELTRLVDRAAQRCDDILADYGA